MTNEPDVSEGGCACGEVRYRMAGPPMFVHCCHCSWCQRETGSAFAVNALIEADRVTLLAGKPQGIDTPSASGKGQRVWRCPGCQVAVWSNYAGGGERMYFVRVGTLDAGHRVEPDIHIYTASKQTWVVIPDGKPATEGYYDARRFRPDESLERGRRLRNANL